MQLSSGASGAVSVDQYQLFHRLAGGKACSSRYHTPDCRTAQRTDQNVAVRCDRLAVYNSTIRCRHQLVWYFLTKVMAPVAGFLIKGS